MEARALLATFTVNQGAGINLGTGKLNVIESTVSGNEGAGVYITFHSNGLTNIDSSTITANASGGISAGAAVNLANSIVAGNTAFDVNGLITSQGYNLMQNTSFGTISGVTTGNILGQDAKLAPWPTTAVRPRPIFCSRVARQSTLAIQRGTRIRTATC